MASPELTLQTQFGAEEGRAASALEGSLADPIEDKRLGDIQGAGSALNHADEQRVVLHEGMVAVTASGEDGLPPVDDCRVIERIMDLRVAGDVSGVEGRHALADELVGVFNKLQQAGPDDVSVGDERELNLEAVGHRDIVRVHSGDHVVPA